MTSEQQPEQQADPAARPERPATLAPRDERPQPAFGELAPEGWEWKPEGERAAEPAPAARAAGGSRAAGSGSGPVPGVPHNLGVSGAPAPAAEAAPTAPPAGPQSASAPQPPAAPPAPQRPAASGEPAPYRAAAPTGAPTPPRPAGAPAGPRVGDRVVTIVLLVIGAFGALNTAASFFTLQQSLVMMSSMLGVDDPTIAGWVGPLGTAGALVTLALYAVTAIYSVRRMRANRLTFWVPLVAAAISMVLVLVVQLIAMYGGAPDLIQQLQTDPTGSMDKMMEYLQGAG